jgi:hypothetical protein
MSALPHHLWAVTPAKGPSQEGSKPALRVVKDRRDEGSGSVNVVSRRDTGFSGSSGTVVHGAFI